MTAAFQVHWSFVPPEDAADLVSDDCRLLAIWPAPVNHDRCFENAGFTLFADNDDAWDQAAETLLRRVIETLSEFGPVELVSEPLLTDLPWHVRLFRKRLQRPLQEQALLPMQCDDLPDFHARFGSAGAALRTGSGHFLLWVSLPATSLPAANPVSSLFVERVAEPWMMVQTPLRWSALLPG